MALWHVGGQHIETRGTFHSAQNSGNFGQKPNVTDHFGWGTQSFQLVRQKCPFHLGKLLSPVPFFCTLLTRTITKCIVAWVRSVQPECTVKLGMWNFQNFTPEFLLNGKHPRLWTRICVDLKGFASLYVLAWRIFCTTWIRNIPLETCVRADHLKCQEVSPV